MSAIRTVNTPAQIAEYYFTDDPNDNDRCRCK